MHWLETDLGIWKWESLYLGGQLLSPMFDERDVEVAGANLAALTEYLGRPFVYENPPVYLPLEELDQLTYMERLSERVDTAIALDLSHLAGYCMITKRDFWEYVDGWSAWDDVVELHVTGYDVYELAQGPLWIDRHSEPLTPFDLETVEYAVAHAPNLKAITLEMEGATRDVRNHNLQQVLDRVAVR